MTRKKKIVNKRGATKGDGIIGQRIRIRRIELNISQSDLAEKLGVSFQQVQKYEKGVNRVGADRLQLISSVLQVPITFFYGDGEGAKGAEVESLVFSDTKFSLRLMRAYVAIDDKTTQRHLVELMESIASKKIKQT